MLSENIKIKIHRSIILPVVLYGCGTWSLTLRKERRLRVFENRVLRRIFGPKREDEDVLEKMCWRRCAGEDVLEKMCWRRMHSEELYNLYLSPNIVRVIISRRMGWNGHAARMGEREVYTGFWWGDLRESGHL